MIKHFMLHLHKLKGVTVGDTQHAELPVDAQILGCLGMPDLIIQRINAEVYGSVCERVPERCVACCSDVLHRIVAAESDNEVVIII